VDHQHCIEVPKITAVSEVAEGDRNGIDFGFGVGAALRWLGLALRVECIPRPQWPRAIRCLFEGKTELGSWMLSYDQRPIPQREPLIRIVLR
jgi:hypothetical protein